MVADFFGEVLFTGDNQRIANMLRSENALGLVTDSQLHIESLQEEFINEVAKEKRSLLQRIVDFIRDIIRSFKGTKQTDPLLKELQKLEGMLQNVIDSEEVEKQTDKKYSFAGYSDDGKGKYKSNFPIGTPKQAKAERILNYIKNVWSKKPIKLKIEENGITRYIWAKFDPQYDESGNIPTDASKLMGGNRHGSSSEQRVTLDLADDYYQIASESKYNYSKNEIGKDNPAHKNVKKWHYFINDIYFAEYDSETYAPYRVSINVKEKTDGNYVYSFSAEKEKELSTHRTLHADVNGTESANAKLFDNRISQNESTVNTYSMQESENNSSSAENDDVSHSFGSPAQSLRYDSERYANWLKRKYRSEADTGELSEKLKTAVKLYNKFQTAEADSIIKEISADIAETVKPELTTFAQGVIDYLKGGEVSLNASQAAELKNRGISNGEFKKVTGLKITEDGTPLDTRYTELANEYPERFDGDISDADQAVELFEKLSDIKQEYLEEDTEGIAESVAKDIKHTLDTTGGRYEQKRLRSAVKEAKAQLDVPKEKNKIKREFERKRKRLENRLTKPKQNGHIPKPFTSAIADVLDSFKEINYQFNDELVAAKYAADLKYLEQKLQFETDETKKDEIQDRFNRKWAKAREMADNINRLSSAFKRLKDNESSSAIWDSDVQALIDYAKEAVGNTPAHLLSLSQMTAVNNAMSAIEKQIENYDKAISLDYEKKISEIGSQWLKDIRLANQGGFINGILNSRYVTSMLDPTRFIRRISKMDFAQYVKSISSNRDTVELAQSIIDGDKSDLALGELYRAALSESTNAVKFVNEKLGESILNTEGKLREIVEAYEDAVQKGAIYDPETQAIYDTIKSGYAGLMPESLAEMVGEFAYRASAYMPKAVILGRLNDSVLQSNANGDIISDSENTVSEDGGAEYGGAERIYNDSEWSGRTLSNKQVGIGKSQENNGRVQSYSRENRRNISSIRDKGNNRGIELTPEQSESLKSTTVKNEDGTPKEVYHFTDNMDFDTFAKGDIGFHFGSESQALQHKENLKSQNKLQGKGRILKAYLDIKYPLKCDFDLEVWYPAHTAIKLFSIGVITQEQYLKIEKLHIENGKDYNSPAAIELRRILSEKGYDGIEYSNYHEGAGESYIAFYPEQVIITDDGKNTKATSENEAASFMPENRRLFSEESKLSKAKAQERLISIAQHLDKEMKLVFVKKDSIQLKGRKGKYVRSTNTLFISKDASIAEQYVEVFKHEFVHRLESRKSYASFKNYLINNSSAFEKYVRASLKLIYKKEFVGTREEAVKALAEYYQKKLYKEIKDFNRESAEREIVADFAGDILFKGKKYLKDTAVKLADEVIAEEGDAESSLEALEEIAKTDRNLFQKLLDAIKDLINAIMGRPQTQSITDDLRYIENRLKQVYDSSDTKKAASAAAEEQFSVKTNNDGKKIVVIDTDQGLFVGVDESEYRKIARDYLNEHFKNTILPLSDYGLVSVNKSGIGKYTYSGKKIENSANNAKMKSATELDNLLRTAEYIKSTDDRKNHNFAADGFDYYRTRFIVDGRVFEGIIDIGVSEKGAEFYGMTNIKNVTSRYYDKYSDLLSGYKSVTQSDIPNNRISQDKTIVNTNYTQESENYSETESEDGQFSVGSPMQQARENRIKYDNGEMTREEYLEENDRLWGEANEKYGSITEGENASNPISVPKQVTDDKNTERFIRTVLESGKLDENMVTEVEDQLLNGEYSYKPVSDESAMNNAEAAIENGTAAEEWENAVNGTERISKRKIAIGEKLLTEAAKAGDAVRVVELSAELADVLTRAGQVVQAARMLKQMTGEGRLVSLQRKVKTLNKDIRSRHGDNSSPAQSLRYDSERYANWLKRKYRSEAEERIPHFV